jgi:hypothetical protein
MAPNSVETVIGTMTSSHGYLFFSAKNLQGKNLQGKKSGTKMLRGPSWRSESWSSTRRRYLWRE